MRIPPCAVKPSVMKRTADTAAALLVALLVTAGCSDNDPEKPLASAREYLQKNDLKSATIQVKNALQINPDLGEARFLLGTILLREGNPSCRGNRTAQGAGGQVSGRPGRSRAGARAPDAGPEPEAGGRVRRDPPRSRRRRCEPADHLGRCVQHSRQARARRIRPDRGAQGRPASRPGAHPSGTAKGSGPGFRRRPGDCRRGAGERRPQRRCLEAQRRPAAVCQGQGGRCPGSVSQGGRSAPRFRAHAFRADDGAAATGQARRSSQAALGSEAGRRRPSPDKLSRGAARLPEEGLQARPGAGAAAPPDRPHPAQPGAGRALWNCSSIRWTRQRDIWQEPSAPRPSFAWRAGCWSRPTFARASLPRRWRRSTMRWARTAWIRACSWSRARPTCRTATRRQPKSISPRR